MADKKKPVFPFHKDKDTDKKSPADNNNILKNAQKAGEAIGNKAMEIKGSAIRSRMTSRTSSPSWTACLNLRLQSTTTRIRL